MSPEASVFVVGAILFLCIWLFWDRKGPVDWNGDNWG